MPTILSPAGAGGSRRFIPSDGEWSQLLTYRRLCVCPESKKWMLIGCPNTIPQRLRLFRLAAYPNGIFNYLGHFIYFWQPPSPAAENADQACTTTCIRLLAYHIRVMAWCVIKDLHSACPSTRPGQTVGRINRASVRQPLYLLIPI